MAEGAGSIAIGDVPRIFPASAGSVILCGGFHAYGSRSKISRRLAGRCKPATVGYVRLILRGFLRPASRFFVAVFVTADAARLNANLLLSHRPVPCGRHRSCRVSCRIRSPPREGHAEYCRENLDWNRETLNGGPFPGVYYNPVSGPRRPDPGFVRVARYPDGATPFGGNKPIHEDCRGRHQGCSG